MPRKEDFYNENHRVDSLKSALSSGDFDAFKSIIIESGHSSFMFNQNVFSVKQPSNQPVSVALSICERVLAGKGAWRVHGGGFAGTIQAFVPDSARLDFTKAITAVFGDDSCHILKGRSQGGIKVY